MKKPFLIICLLFFVLSCNMNPNKEDRLQKLETEMELVTAKVSDLETKIQTLEDANALLRARLDGVEK